MFLHNFKVSSNLNKLRLSAAFALLFLQLLLILPPSQALAFGSEQPVPATLVNASYENHVDGQNIISDGLVALKLRDLAGAERFVAEVNNSSSPLYQQYLTPAQFMQRFGPDETTTNQVKAFYQDKGFEVERNGLLLNLKANVATFEQAFNVKINNYGAKIDGELQQFFSADRRALIADALKPYVQSVQLHNRQLRHAASLSLANSSSTLAQTVTPPKPNGLSPNQFRRAYNVQPLLDAGTQGQGQNIAFVQLSTYNQADVNTYAQQYGISGYKLEDIVVSNNRLSPNGAGEVTLDIEIAIGIAPQATVLVYQAGNNVNQFMQIYSRIINDNRAVIASSSWGRCESYYDDPERDTFHSILTQGGAQGLQFFNASGDSGAFDCNDPANQFPQRAVDYPASDPNSISVGGTSLQVDGNGVYGGESAWSNSSDKSRSATGSGSGGGLSLHWERPAWQNAPGTQNQYSNGKRQLPDVAANSDPATGFAIYCTTPPNCSPNRPWLRVGGTSAAAPLWAASALLINQYTNKKAVTLPKLYELAAQPQPFPSYRDIVSGNNLYYPATPGYDMATGLGTPDIFNIARNLGSGQVNPDPNPNPAPDPNPAPPLTPNPAGFADTAFSTVWTRTDKLVASGAVARTWVWGQQPLISVTEPYAEAPEGKRQVQYFDKSRMEINNPAGDKNNPYYVSNGLLTKEMISGQIQLGNNNFQNKAPANIGVAGDPDDKIGVTYANLSRHLGAAPNPLNVVIYATLNRNGDLGQNPYFGQYNISAIAFIKETNHTVAQPFWDYLNSQGPVIGIDGRTSNGALFNPTFYATGLPISEPYWTQVKVGGQVKDVLVQAFERRVLTYTPSNAPQWRVEMGNVGQHYYRWRYQS